jgi:hypothetical protein
MPYTQNTFIHDARSLHALVMRLAQRKAHLEFAIKDDVSA